MFDNHLSVREHSISRIMSKRVITSVLVAAVVLLAGTAAEVMAQEAVAYDASREELRQRLDSLEAAIPADASGDDATRLLRRAQRIQDRLDNGDLRTGDMIRIGVEGDSLLSGTYRVTEGRAIDVPTVGRIDVSGLLYSEVAARVREELGAVVRTPRIQVQPLIRIAVLGQVASPGYYDLSPAATVSDALMAAGGPTQNAEIQNTRLRQPEENGGGDGERVESLTGRSLAELGVTRGNEVFVPGSGGGLSFGTITTILGVVSSVTLIVTRF